MPTFSDLPYPFNCLLKGFASNFERYQPIELTAEVELPFSE